jgi:myo-inositol-hexaphosphate 3-phosphohydrolase
VHVGKHDVELKLRVPTFPGKPVSDKDTDCDEPLVRVKTTVPAEALPACTVPEPGETLIEKPNGDEVVMK